jgi:2'-5' RNA ligase
VHRVSADRATAPRKLRGLRLFIALWPTPAVHAALCARRDAIRWPPHARVVPDQRLHLTLHFIGRVPSAPWPRLLPALQEVRCGSLELELGAAQQWPHGLVVLPVAAVPPPLSALHTALAGALTDLGLPVERRVFRPHVTLARGAAGAGLPRDAAPMRWRARGYVLVNSDPVDGYRVLARCGERGVTLARAPRTATARKLPTPAPTQR